MTHQPDPEMLAMIDRLVREPMTWEEADAPEVTARDCGA